MNKFKVTIPLYRHKKCVGVRLHEVEAKDKTSAIKKAKSQFAFSIRVKNPHKKRTESCRMLVKQKSE